jgi:hypothetical protein
LLAAPAVVIAGIVIACIPEPPPDLPDLPRARPTILRASVVPPASAVLGSFPSKFIVPVELADPTESFLSVAYIHYNPLTGSGRQGRAEESRFERSNTVGRVRTIDVVLSPPAPDRCHVIDVIVARRFEDEARPRRPVDPPGGDIVTWFYSPSGTLAGCPSLDAGFDAEPPPSDGGLQ